MTTHFFDLSDRTQGLARNLAEGVDTRIFFGDKVMLSIVEIAPGAEGMPHSHPEEQWGMVLAGSGVRHQDGVDHHVAVGHFWRTPGGMTHGFRAGPEGVTILDVFSPPRPAYKTEGQGFGD